MRNSIGNNLVLTLFGESHGPAVGAVLDGMRSGIEVSDAMIARYLAERRPLADVESERCEPDKFQILSGVFNGFTTGAPICIIMPNEDVRTSDYERSLHIARPGHADYTAHVKYQGFEDWRGGGHFSGRLTAAIVAVGAICLKDLETRGITVNTKVIEGGAAEDILAAKAEGDSTGGIVQTTVNGVPVGVGEPWFDSLEGVIAKAVLSIGGIKGVEFGAGFGFAGMRGSQANDPFRVAENGSIYTETNNNGGINGGISNGMPVVFNCVVKPTPSISKPQKSINLQSGEEVVLELKGRHDPSIVRRICPVISAMTAFVICDLLTNQ